MTGTTRKLEVVQSSRWNIRSGPVTYTVRTPCPCRAATVAGQSSAQSNVSSSIVRSSSAVRTSRPS
ncbi:hypothetical protein ACFQ1L_11105 [Phytohabitans flavus]|uniref:hypothetical protein n=1 Tax=Phytohabitans flavus TaxID=1076124 RepID=UPI00362F7944